MMGKEYAEKPFIEQVRDFLKQIEVTDIKEITQIFQGLVYVDYIGYAWTIKDGKMVEGSRIDTRERELFYDIRKFDVIHKKLWKGGYLQPTLLRETNMACLPIFPTATMWSKRTLVDVLVEVSRQLEAKVPMIQSN